MFMQAFVAEAQAMLRAHVSAIGGNALVSYKLNEIVLFDNPHKRQVSVTETDFMNWHVVELHEVNFAPAISQFPKRIFKT